jgi:hypothetical protein
VSELELVSELVSELESVSELELESVSEAEVEVAQQPALLQLLAEMFRQRFVHWHRLQ